ncbi:outer membrane protein assembly factor BamE [Halomonas sp. V046]|uniref:outer membrane protein assembly factor BamE n=1 Tax=Halomonas sp. V046 TaxID=3459611 RepID=UPI004044C46B
MIDRPHDSEEQAQMQKLTGIVTLSLALALTSGCTYFSVYKRDLAQGNLVTNEMVNQLRPGMSRQEVVSVMGSPLLEAPFDESQWDYVYRLDEAYGDVMQRRLTLTFAGNQLTNIEREGDFSMDPNVAGQAGGYGVGPTSGGAEESSESGQDIQPIYNRTIDPEKNLP